jgi:hypothetical protein
LKVKLRRIYDSIQMIGNWHCRWNSEIYSLYKDLNIVDDINIIRLGWAGHIITLEEYRKSRKVLNGKV